MSTINAAATIRPESRLTHCWCGCGRVTLDHAIEDWALVWAPERGKQPAYICPTCQNFQADYSDDNNADPRGTMTRKNLTTGFEFETVCPTIQAQAYFMRHKFLPSYDCTVDQEFKSPVYNSLNPVKKIAATLDKLQANGDFAVNYKCGTHVHIGAPSIINGYSNRAIASRYAALFGPLSDYMAAHPEQTARVFGRELGGWAKPIDRNYPYEHTNFINLQHANTLEYRVCKFINAAQFMLAIKTCQAFTLAIINNYLPYAYTDKADHKAEITANKLVKLFVKAAKQA